MELKNLSLRDKGIFDNFLGFQKHELSTYAFENIYIWKGLFDIKWGFVDGSLCVFFQNKIGCFLYLAPLGASIRPSQVKEAFRIMDRVNENKEISRIENVEEKDLVFYRDLSYSCRIKSYDYLCARSSLVKLRGDKFKSKRASFNYFIKHYKFEYLPFALTYSDDCLKLYNIWMKQRQTVNKEPVYLGMLQDNLNSLKVLLADYRGLNAVGRIIKIGKDIKAFSFGFKLNSDTFCILYEITDLSIKGLAQFIFRRFSSELKDYRHINIMDDSGLENLKKTKLSYRPQNLIPAYIVTRNNA